MKKSIIKVLSVVLVVVMTITAAPLSGFVGLELPEWLDVSIEAKAVGGVEAKLNQILSVYPTGSYFTVSGSAHYSNKGAECYLANIPARGGLSSGSQAAAVMGNAYSCCAFARYVFYNIFGTNSMTQVSLSNAKIGDYVVFSGHYGIYLSHDANYVYVYDSNYQTNPENKVKYKTAVKMSRFSAVYRATNYDEINGSNYEQIWFHNISNPDNTSCGIDANTEFTISGKYKFWFQDSVADTNYYINIYLDGKLIADHISHDANKYSSVTIDSNTLTDGSHELKADIVHTNGTASTTKRFYTKSYDTEKPVITEAVVAIKGENGYTVTAKVSDNVGVTSVKFPTWIEGQIGDDAIWLEGTYDATYDHWACWIPISNWNNHYGTYYTHVYAYDAAGNKSVGVSVGDYIRVPKINSASDALASSGTYDLSKQTTIYAQGWAYNRNGDTVKLYYRFDGEGNSWHQFNLVDRTDVTGAHSDCKQVKCGYAQNISIADLTTGKHTIDIIVETDDWSKVIATSTFTVVRPQTYTITYNANGGSGAPSSQTKTHGTTLTLSSTKPTRTGYTFLGWSTSSTTTSATYSAGGSFTTNANTTLYAVWKANTYTVKYNANGGSGTMSNSSHTYDVSKALTSNAFTRTGYTFLGWSTSSTATSATYTNSQSVKNLTSTNGGTVTLYAIWKANTYTVKYNANGGSGTMSNSSHTYDVSKALTSNAFTRNGYTFLGWSTSSTATSATYTNGQSVKNLTSTNGGTVTLYAVWHGHKYTSTVTKAATCTATGIRTYTCSGCSHSYTEAIAATGHTWTAATCTVKKICSVCGATSGEPLGHNYTSKVTKAATCTTTGVKTYTCSRCSNSYTESIAATGHTWTAATCTAKKTCSVCKSTSGEALGHSYTSKVTKAATCTATGVKTYTCSRCSHSYTETIAATGHTWTAATCTIAKTCSACKATSGSALGHSYTLKITKPATCTTAGVKTYTCSKCSHSYTETIVAEHEMNNGVCDVCGYKESIKGSCGENVTWSFDGNAGILIISGTGPMESYFDKENNKIKERPWEDYNDEIEIVVIKDGVTSIGDYAFLLNYSITSVTISDSVTSIGDGAFRYCHCLTNVTIPDSVTSIGDGAFAWCDSLTCITVDGDNEYYSSDEYGVLFNKDKTILIQYPVANTRTSYTIPDSVTSIDDAAFAWCDSLTSITIPDSVISIGDSTFSDCENLTDVYYSGTQSEWNQISIGAYNDSLMNATIHCMGIEEHVHSYNSIVTPPTCTEIGYTTYICDCGDSYKADNIAALGHSYTSTVTKAATCTTAGTRKHTCSRCSDSYTETIAATGHTWTAATCTEKKTCSVCKTTSGEALGHSCTSKVTKAATCTATGVRTYTCSRCSNSYTETIAATGHTWTAATCTAKKTCSVCKATSGEALGHSYTSKVTKAPTCTTAGVKTYTCSRCSHSYTETIAATGHTWTAATCTAKKTCSVCKATSGEALGHSYTSKITKAATCTATGVKTYTCSRCSNSYTESIAATGHTWIAATCTAKKTCSVCKATSGEALGHSYTSKVTKAPTCTTTGVKTYTCSKCSNSYTEAIAATGHKYTSVVTTPTCTAKGYTTYTCSVCKDTYKANETAATGHKYTYAVISPTCSTDGYTTYNCSACGDTYIADEIDATGHSYSDGVCIICGEKDPSYTDEPEYNYTFSIQSPSRTEVRHKDGIKLHAKVEGTAPAGSYVKWTASNGKFKTEEINGGNSLKIISDSNGNTTFTATLYSKDGEVIATDTIEMKSKAGFFDKIGSFFRSLFGGTKIYEN